MISSGPDNSYVERIKQLQGKNGFASLLGLINWNFAPPQSSVIPRYPLHAQQPWRPWYPPRITLIRSQHGMRRMLFPLDDPATLRAALLDMRSSIVDEAHPSAGEKMDVLIVGDLAPLVMEELGSRYKIDPRFFEDHIRYEDVPDNRRLLTSGIHRQWFQIRNSRRDDVKTLVPFRESNIVRPRSALPQVGERREKYSMHIFEEAGTVKPATVETRTSIWIGQDPASPNTTIGIVLLDSAEREWQLSSHMHMRDPCVATPDMDSLSTNVEGQLPPTWYDYIIDMTMRYPWFQHWGAQHPADKLLIVCPSLLTVCGEWLDLLATAKDMVARFESRSESENPTGSRSSVVLQQLAEWHEHIQTWREMVVDTLERGLVTAEQLTQPQSSKHFEQIVLDFKRVIRKLDALQNRIDRIIDRGTADLQLEAARQSLEAAKQSVRESHNLARLSWLATIFIPLTFITGLFSMGDDLGSMTTTFKTYFEVAIPVALVALVIAGKAPSIKRDTQRFARWVLQRLRDAWYHMKNKT